MVVHVTPWDKEHTHTRVRSILFAWWLDACAVGPKAFALRSHVNGIVGTCADRQTTPQVPRIPVSLFPRRPTAHAQTTKSSPRPLASQKSRKTHCFRVKKIIFVIKWKTNLEPGLQAGRVWRPSDVTPLILMNEQKKWCLPLGRKSHERWMRPFDIVVVTCVWPWFD